MKVKVQNIFYSAKRMNKQTISSFFKDLREVLRILEFSKFLPTEALSIHLLCTQEETGDQGNF